MYASVLELSHLGQMDNNHDKKVLKELGKRIEKIRKTKKMSYRNLSFSADLSISYLQKLETGVSNPSYITLLRLADALNISLNDFDIKIK